MNLLHFIRISVGNTKRETLGLTPQETIWNPVNLADMPKIRQVISFLYSDNDNNSNNDNNNNNDSNNDNNNNNNNEMMCVIVVLRPGAT